MKVGIVTNYEWIKQWCNYGTVMQNYALQKVLNELGHESWWIRTTNRNVYTPAEHLRNAIIKYTHEPLELLQRFNKTQGGHQDLSHESPPIQSFNSRHPRSLEGFLSKHVNLSEIEYDGDDLRNQPPNADAYIVGSDNVWAQVSNAYFLDFGPPDVIRIAYAVSAPWENLSPSWHWRARVAIRKIDHLSVREDIGIAICNRLGRKDGVNVLDPTLMADPRIFDELVLELPADPLNGEPTLLVYWLNTVKPGDWPLDGLRELADRMRWRLRIIPLQGTEVITPEEYVMTPDPIEWLGAIKNAKAVVTNSFHGTAFSVIFRKPFVSMPDLQGKSEAGKGRFSSLLGKLGLDSRISREVSADSIQKILNDPIDWEQVEVRLAAERRHSRSFLEKSLKH